MRFHIEIAFHREEFRKFSYKNIMFINKVLLILTYNMFYGIKGLGSNVITKSFDSYNKIWEMWNKYPFLKVIR